jgi:hypothetical protein
MPLDAFTAFFQGFPVERPAGGVAGAAPRRTKPRARRPQRLVSASRVRGDLHSR